MTSNIQLYQGDCLEVMKNIPDKSVDLVFTSPPYNLGVSSGDITFSLCVESVGQTLGNYYVNAIQRSTIEFKTKIRIESDQIGSIYLYPIGTVQCRGVDVEYFYKGILVKGEETSRIAKAVYEGLS